MLISTAPPAMAEGNKAPDFQVFDLDGFPHELSDYTGKPLLLDFMATWCTSCKDTISSLVALHGNYDEDVMFLSIATDDSESDDDLRDYHEEHNVTWLQARDSEDEMQGDYEVSAISYLVLVNADGEIVWDKYGVAEHDEIKAALDELSDEPDKKGFLPGFQTTIALAGISIMAIIHHIKGKKFN